MTAAIKNASRRRKRMHLVTRGSEAGAAAQTEAESKRSMTRLDVAALVMVRLAGQDFVRPEELLQQDDSRELVRERDRPEGQRASARSSMARVEPEGTADHEAEVAVGAAAAPPGIVRAPGSTAPCLRGRGAHTKSDAGEGGRLALEASA